MTRNVHAVDSAQYTFTPVPRLGETVRVKLRDEGVREFTGRVVVLPVQTAPDEFGLWVEGSMVPMRGIRLSRCHSLNGKPVRAAPAGPAPTPSQRSRVFDVPGSKPGRVYQVRVFGDGSKTCTCASFGFRQRCRHIEEVK